MRNLGKKLKWRLLLKKFLRRRITLCPIRLDPSLQSKLRTEPADVRVITETVHAPGEVVLDPQQVAIVTSRIEGQIDHLLVRLGDHVRIGQRLTTIVSLHLNELVQEYLVTKAQADVAEDSFRRSEKLVGEKVAPLRQLVETRGRHRETQAHFQHVREKLINMGLTSEELRQLERSSHEENHRYTLKAPIAGTVITQNVVRGQGVAPGEQLFQIVDTSRLWIFANLPLEQGKRFKEGDMGTILPKGGDPIKAPLTYVAPVADEKTRTGSWYRCHASPRFA